jgi:hypothetical protein
MAWLLCLPVGQASSLGRATARRFFWLTGLKRVFQRGPTVRIRLPPPASPAKPAADTRAESRGSRPSKADAGERRTLRWRKGDSNSSVPPRRVHSRTRFFGFLACGSAGPAEASLGGTSHLRLPRLLQWFTGNIGFHHVHHVNPRIPNYRLEECHNADARFRSASTLTLRTGLQALAYTLWDSDLVRLVPFRFAAAG